MSDLDALMERVEAATGADRHLDADLALALRDLPAWMYADAAKHGVNIDTGYIDTVTNAGQCGCGILASEYTASLDAALALVERKLPGWLYGVRHTSTWCPEPGSDLERWAGKPVWDAEIVDFGDSDSAEPFCDPADADEDDGVQIFDAKHCSPALALISALLRALKSAEGKETP